MEWEKLPDNWGYIRADYKFGESSPLRAVASFLSEAAYCYVDFNIKYRNKIGANDFPFFSGEFQNQAIFFKSMCDVLERDCLPFPEHPYQYKHRQANAERHRLDYWVLLKGRIWRICKDIVLLVEYKHTSINLRQKESRTKNCKPFVNTAGVTGGWGENKRRLKKLGTKLKRNQELKGDISRWDGRDRHIVLVNFVTVPVMIVSETEERIRNKTVSKKQLDDWKYELAQTLEPKPNCKILWWLGEGPGRENHNMDYWKEKQRTYYYKYFGAYFFARLDRL